GHDNGEAEVPGGGFAFTGLQNKLPQQLGPVSPPPPGVKAGRVVRSGALTPGLYHTAVSYKQLPAHQKSRGILVSGLIDQ
ncbi:hypothetical protein ACVGW2_06965, partial [Enterobacter intestinihominis]